MELDDPKARDKVLSALADYQGKGDILDQQADLEKALKEESHRGLLVILVSHLEDALLDRIIQEIPKGADYRRQLSKGPLKSVENRIVMGKALGLLTEREAIVMDVFKAMRNACAHSRRDISFATPELADALKLVLAEDGKSMIDEIDADGRMGAFITCSTYLISFFKGSTHDETYARMGQLVERLGAGGEVRSADLMLATLQEIRTGTPSQDSPQTTNDQAQ